MCEVITCTLGFVVRRVSVQRVTEIVRHQDVVESIAPWLRARENSIVGMMDTPRIDNTKLTQPSDAGAATR
jgi:hypothetical protein